MIVLRLWAFSMLVGFYSCKTKEISDHHNYTEQKIILVGLSRQIKETDTLAEITLKTLSRLDTFYKWIDWSDCGPPCARIKYRFTDKRYSQYAESGWIYSRTPDSLYQFTIVHKPWNEPGNTSENLKPLSEKDTSPIFKHLLYTLSYCEKYSVPTKEFRIINNRPFIITGFQTPCSILSNKETRYLIGTTTLKTRFIYFIAECCGKDTIGFTNSMYKTLLSIKINER